jgi:GNAT superfamily N-acetyltransferase
MTLDQFIQDARSRRTVASRAHVDEPYFETLYVRLTRRHIDGSEHWPVLDLASLSVHEAHRGQGRFTKLVERIRTQHPMLHLFVENVMEPRFQEYLARCGFAVVEPRLNPPCYFMAAKEHT